jgi:hypothetical protein
VAMKYKSSALNHSTRLRLLYQNLRILQQYLFTILPFETSLSFSKQMRCHDMVLTSHGGAKHCQHALKHEQLHKAFYHVGFRLLAIRNIMDMKEWPALYSKEIILFLISIPQQKKLEY